MNEGHKEHPIIQETLDALAHDRRHGYTSPLAKLPEKVEQLAAHARELESELATADAAEIDARTTGTSIGETIEAPEPSGEPSGEPAAAASPDAGGGTASTEPTGA